MHRKSIFTYPKETWIQKQDRRMNRKGDGNVISYAEQKILEDIEPFSSGYLYGTGESL